MDEDEWSGGNSWGNPADAGEAGVKKWIRWSFRLNSSGPCLAMKAITTLHLKRVQKPNLVSSVNDC